MSIVSLKLTKSQLNIRLGRVAERLSHFKCFRVRNSQVMGEEESSRRGDRVAHRPSRGGPLCDGPGRVTSPACLLSYTSLSSSFTTAKLFGMKEIFYVPSSSDRHFDNRCFSPAARRSRGQTAISEESNPSRAA